eukprot:429458-Pleurochrysis_carterae.AAC.6
MLARLRLRPQSYVCLRASHASVVRIVMRADVANMMRCGRKISDACAYEHRVTAAACDECASAACALVRCALGPYLFYFMSMR